MADWRKGAREKVAQKQQGSRFKLSVGENCFRILPNAKSLKRPPYYEYLVHRDVGPNKQIVRCGKDLETGEGECWLCDEVIPKLQKKKHKKSAQVRAAALVAKDQMAVQVASLDIDSGKWRGPLIWYVPTGGAKSMSTALLATLASPRRRYDDPKEGYNLNVTRTGTGRTDTRYGPIEPDNASSKVPSKVLNALKAFSKVLPQYDEEVQRAAYYGRDIDRSRSAVADEDNDEGDNRLAKKKRKDEDEDSAKKKRKKGKKVEDDDEDEDDDSDDEEEEDDDSDEEDEDDDDSDSDEDEDDDSDDDDDEDDDKKSKKSKKKKKKKSDDDDDEDEESEDEDEEEDDEDDDKKSKKSKKSKKKKSDDDDDEDEEEEEEEDEDEDDEDDDKKSKKSKKSKAAGKKKGGKKKK